MSLEKKLKQIFEEFDVVEFLERKNVKYDQWLKGKFFDFAKELEKSVLGLLVEDGEK